MGGERMTRQPNPHDFEKLTIAGQGGGMGKDGGGGGDEAPNTLKSRQVAKVVDLISEGPIKGWVGGMRGVLLDGVQLQADNGQMNFKGASVQGVLGYPAQGIMNGFAAQQAEIGVNVQLKASGASGGYVTRNILNTDTDRVRVTVSVPTLQHIDKETGDISGSSVSFRIQCDNNGGGFKTIGDYTISGKTTSKYQRAIMFLLPKGGPWDIRVARTTADSTVQELQNDLYWDSYTAIIDDRVNYSHSACMGVMVDAEQFRSIPKRTHHVDGLLCRIPINYADNRTSVVYQGVWNGNFRLAWTCNPAWVFYDLIINNRYGLGGFISANEIDKWALYKIAQWCDGYVPDGHGGQQRRWTCNVQIMGRQEAFDLLGDILSIFRGFSYWTGGQMVPVADQPSDPVIQFTNANVIEGVFNYSGSDIRARHTVASVTWNDPEQLGEMRMSVVEDQDAISRFGIQRVDVPAIGCTNEAQAIRTGKWQLFTEQYESEIVQFGAGLEAAYAKPGAIARIADINIAGRRYGGRVGAGSTMNRLYLDAPLSPGSLDLIANCLIGADAHIEVRNAVANQLVDATYLDILQHFSADPIVDTSYVINDPGLLEPTLWRIREVKQTEGDRYQVSAVRHLPSKWDYVELNKVLTFPDVSDITARPPAVTNLRYIEYLIQLSPISVGVRVTLSWESEAPLFDVWFRKQNENWQRVRVESNACDLPVTEGPWQFTVTPIGTIGLKGPTTALNATIIGRSAPPDPPLDLRINVVDGVAMFNWRPSTELDVIIGGHFELRFNARLSGVTWADGQTIIPTIPGRASSVEAPYQRGTWMLRTFDILETPSPTWATVVSGIEDGRYTNFTRVCENPTFLGSKQNTEIMYPQEWLIIGATGGLWDDQLANMDTWPDVDDLPGDNPDPTTGQYYHYNRIDAGGVFPVRLSSEILAFPFSVGGDFIDARLDNCDDWPNWDSTAASLNGTVTLYFRQTDDDPTLPGARWSAYVPFSPGEYTARAWEFRTDLWAPVGQNIGVEELCILADLRKKIDDGNDVPYPGDPTVLVHVNFNVKFFAVPAVVVTVQNPTGTDNVATDNVYIRNKTRTGFDIEIINPLPSTHPVRLFDWHAQGY